MCHAIVVGHEWNAEQEPTAQFLTNQMEAVLTLLAGCVDPHGVSSPTHLVANKEHYIILCDLI